MQSIKYYVVALCAVMLAQIAVGQSPQSLDKQRSEYRRAVDLFEKEKYSSAQHAFEKYIDSRKPQKDGDVESAYFFSAVCAQLLSNQDALVKLEEFMRMYPQSAHINMAHLFLGNHYYSGHNYKQALYEYRLVDDSQIEYGYRSEFDFKMGYSLFQTGDVKNAKSHFSRLMTGKSKYANSALYYYAHIQYEEENYDLALGNFLKLQKDKKFGKIVPFYIAQIYYFLDKDNELIQMAPELIEQSSDTRKAEIQQMVGEVCYRKGEYAEALKYYESANGLSQQNNYYQMGFCNYQLQRYGKAIPYFEHYTTESDSVAQNALYHLADVYLKVGKKSEARTMFRQVADMQFNEKIKEDALYNYAKLSCEIGGAPYNESILMLQNYLKQYPNTTHKDEISQILTSLYFSTRNYRNALELIEKLPNRTHSLNQAYQRIALNRGIELFNENNINDAIGLFTKAININAIAKTTADAYYLRGESHYRLRNYNAAKKDLDKFFVTSSAESSEYYKQAAYTLGYTNYKLKNYGTAIDDMKKFIGVANKNNDNRQIDDANNRIGDGYYVQKQFDNAITYYNKVISGRGIYADYACYQKAMSYSALCRYDEKIKTLNALLQNYPNSDLAPSASFEIASTYLLNDDNVNALASYQSFLASYPQSTYAKEALLKTGIIYYNTQRETEALATLDQVLKSYPGTSESRDALLVVKNIYSAQGRISDYFEYVQNSTNVVISNNSQDSMTFMAAENFYFDGENEKAISGLNNYLKRFPHGLFVLSAHYYLADCLDRMGKAYEALPHYEFVAEQAKSQYTETALLRAAQISFNEKRYTESNKFFGQLSKKAESNSNMQQANLGLLRTYYLLNDFENSVIAANKVLSYEKITAQETEEATYYKARSLYNLKRYDAAIAVYRTLQSADNGEYAGEANYREAELYFNNKDYVSAENAIEEATSNPRSDYWSAKTFILWAEIFYINGNSLQAKQTLQSIIDNYDGEDLVQEAIQRRNQIIQDENAIKAQAEADNTNEEPEIITVEEN